MSSSKARNVTAISVRLAAVAKRSKKATDSLPETRPHDKVNFVRDGEAFFKNLTKIFALQLDFFKHLLECADQIEDSDFRFKQRAGILELQVSRGLGRLTLPAAIPCGEAEMPRP